MLSLCSHDSQFSFPGIKRLNYIILSLKRERLTAEREKARLVTGIAMGTAAVIDEKAVVGGGKGG